jgi:retron-type reverse transcriptase
VLASKLSGDEARQLDQQISIQELDVSAAEGKVKTAAGADGINNAFVKQFWQYFRVPLHNYMNCCFRKGALTSNFSTANIKLIPKKGDLTNI